jgi:hypothetical protein
MKRTALIRRTPLTSGSQLARVTPLCRPAAPPPSRFERRAEQRRTTRSPGKSDFSVTAKRAMRGRSEGRCEWHQGCPQEATDRSHRQRRTRGNGFASNGVHLCHSHHMWCHANPIQARDLGLIVSLPGDYRATPVLTRHSRQKIYLFDNGGWSIDPSGVAT